MSLALARDVHGACPRCVPITWHSGPCPFWGAATERERSVPCSSCQRPTFRNDGFCSDDHARCAALRSGLAREGGRVPVHPAPTPLTHQERAARNEATAQAVERLIAATVPGAGASQSALHQPPAPGAPRVLP